MKGLMFEEMGWVLTSTCATMLLFEDNWVYPGGLRLGVRWWWSSKNGFGP